MIIITKQEALDEIKKYLLKLKEQYPLNFITVNKEMYFKLSGENMQVIINIINSIDRIN